MTLRLYHPTLCPEPMENGYTELLERLDRGERELRAMRHHARLARGLTVASLAAGVLFLTTRPAATQGQFVSMIQAAGGTKVKAPLMLVVGLGEGSSPDGTATGRGLTVFDPSQKVLGVLGLGKNGASEGRGLTLNDATGAPVAGLGNWPQRPDRGQLVLTDQNQNSVYAQPPLP